MIYQFAFHSNVPARPPASQMFDLYYRIQAGEKLSREEKDRVADALYGLFGQSSATFKLGGWAVPFARLLPCFWVQFTYGSIEQYFAPDKVSLRQALTSRGGLGIVRIVQIPE